MKAIWCLFILCVIVFTSCNTPDEMEIHVWDTHELTFRAEKTYSNPYMEVETWVLLTGPENGIGIAELLITNKLK